MLPMLWMVGCGDSPLDGAISCERVREAWEDAGGTAADIDVHLAAMVRINELGISTSPGPEDPAHPWDLRKRRAPD